VLENVYNVRQGIIVVQGSPLEFDLTSQVLKAQETRDNDVRGLSQAMADMFAFMDDIQNLEKIKPLQDTVTAMMVQVQECAKFISEYVGHGFLSKPFFTFQIILNP
jgi:hypothetical protein